MSALSGLRVLIVEDEALIAMMAEDMLENLGCVVVTVAVSLRDAHDALDGHDFDVALLDVNLNGDNSRSVAAAMKKHGKPFVFTTGYGSDGVDAEHGDVPVLTKPYALADLEKVLGALAGRGQAAGTSSITSITDSNRG